MVCGHTKRVSRESNPERLEPMPDNFPAVPNELLCNAPGTRPGKSFKSGVARMRGFSRKNCAQLPALLSAGGMLQKRRSARRKRRSASTFDGFRSSDGEMLQKRRFPRGKRRSGSISSRTWVWAATKTPAPGIEPGSPRPEAGSVPTAPKQRSWQPARPEPGGEKARSESASGPQMLAKICTPTFQLFFEKLAQNFRSTFQLFFEKLAQNFRPTFQLFFEKLAQNFAPKRRKNKGYEWYHTLP
jgi:hypothetical protein